MNLDKMDEELGKFKTFATRVVEERLDPVYQRAHADKRGLIIINRIVIIGFAIGLGILTGVNWAALFLDTTPNHSFDRNRRLDYCGHLFTFDKAIFHHCKYDSGHFIVLLIGNLMALGSPFSRVDMCLYMACYERFIET